MIKTVVDIARRESGEKSPINFQVPIEKKKELDRLCKEHSISITSVMNGLIDVLIQESKGIYQEISADALLKLNNRINFINKELSRLKSASKDNLDENLFYKELIEEKNRIETIFTVQRGFNSSLDAVDIQ